nr:MAG TPA: hypothetical protein [Bacteriophage sp.]
MRVSYICSIALFISISNSIISNMNTISWSSLNRSCLLSWICKYGRIKLVTSSPTINII